MKLLEPDLKQEKIHTVLDIIHNFQTEDLGHQLHIIEDRQDLKLSYAELYRLILEQGRLFREAGIQSGTRVILPFESKLRVIVSFFALIAVGALPLSVKPYGLGGTKESYLNFLSEIVHRYQAQYILNTPSLKNLDLPLPPLYPIGDLTVDSEPEFSFASVSPKDIAFVQFSSGSTSFPKGIPVYHDMLCHQLSMIARQAAAKPSDITSSWLPLYHDMGLVGGFLAPLARRQSIFLRNPRQFLLDPVQWLRHLSDEQVSFTVIPDFALGYCVRRLQDIEMEELESLELSQLRLIFNGSEPIHVEQFEQFRTFLQPFGLKPSTLKCCYGMAEAVLMVTCTGTEETAQSLTLENGCPVMSVGHPLPEYTLQIRHENGYLCGDGEVGEIEIRGGTLVGSYFEDERSFFNADGFYSTGDFGFLRNGYLYVTGRVHDRCKINGQNYFSCDFEYALSTLEFAPIGKVACIFNANQPVILIETKKAESPDVMSLLRQQVTQRILEQLGIKLLPDQIFFIRPRQLEKTSSGKLKRQVITQRFLAGDIRLTEA